MSLFYTLPEVEAFSLPTLVEQKSRDGYVQFRMARIADCLKALTAPPLTDQERAEHASKVAAVRFADEFKRKDLLSQ